MELVEKYVMAKAMIPDRLVAGEVSSFYIDLGIDDMYFEQESVESIGDNIIAFYGAKMQATIRSEARPQINLVRQTEDSAIYIHTALPGHSHPKNYEKTIDQKYLDKSSDQIPYRLESYLSQGKVSSSASTPLRCYLIRQCEFVNPSPTKEQEADINQVSDKNFLFRTTKHTQSLFQDVILEVLNSDGPVLQVHESPRGEKRLLVGFKKRTARAFFSAISDVFHYYGLATVRKHVDQFSNGVTIMSFYLVSANTGKHTRSLAEVMPRVVEAASLIYTLPKNPLISFVQAGTLSVTESIYGNLGWIFSQHFLKKLGNEFKGLASIVDMNNLKHVDVLTNIKKKLRADTFTREYVLEIIELYPDLVKLCYQHFAGIHHPDAVPVVTEAVLLETITKTVQNPNEFKVFESYVTFNKSILKTNFYKPSKVALSFRLDPSVLSEVEYPQPVFGMFMVVGSGFRGFHLRFRDIARGGIRLVRSRNSENYTINLRNLLDENYGLAATQQKKNKDIPEGGSKGTILLDVDHQDKPRVSFEKYVDAILDLLLLDPKDRIKDLYGKPEILFFGPDEGTADMMDWASQHAHFRFWNAFTTGKSQAIGGIPHDTFGMTTRSVHQYVVGIYRKLGLKEEECTKLQIGGPDGDLGSNEIKLSKDKTIGIVDGSGVLFDPNGINRTELMRLATARKMVSHFDTKYLSEKGFFVSIEATDITLPDGTAVASGLKFRNEFHLNPLSSADVFVPCGGRPESVDLSNVHLLFNKDGSPRFKYVVEGANLFITQDARLYLENRGVIVFKDASANKGGVTSSSLEVLAALSLNDQEFHDYMQVQPDKVPEFYNKYVQAVERFIENNATLEFEALWRQWKETGTPISILSDEVSYSIVKLNEELQKTSLWDNVVLRRIVLLEAFPKLLVDTVGLDTLLERVPENYVRAIFGSYLASRFVYKHGTKPSSMSFFEFISPYFSKVSK
ncbi:NAD-dependent glutamate dehydrogenase [Kappamyces sp. JEL0680]|nr:NAD-dependent glutamate dehydrogenase [Kappamyces sp. JEL0680]